MSDAVAGPTPLSPAQRVLRSDRNNLRNSGSVLGLSLIFERAENASCVQDLTLSGAFWAISAGSVGRNLPRVLHAIISVIIAGKLE